LWLGLLPVLLMARSIQQWTEPSRRVQSLPNSLSCCYTHMHTDCPAPPSSWARVAPPSLDGERPVLPAVAALVAVVERRQRRHHLC
jgi:hypothetical protein